MGQRMGGLNTIYQRLPTWNQVREKFWTTRWVAPAINFGCGIAFIGWGFTREGYWRDYFMILGGTQLGFALMWFVTPMRIQHLSEEQRKAISDDMALVMIQAARRAEEAYGRHFPVPTTSEEPPPTTRLN
jgi:hypothetical protein